MTGSFGRGDKPQVFDAGPERFEMIGRYWYATDWPISKRDEAKRAWEHVQRESKYIACWRTEAPQKNPTTATVWLMGEEPQTVSNVAPILRSLGGKPVDPEQIPADFVIALRYRRAEHLRTFDPLNPHQQLKIRTPQGRVMDKQGKLSLYKKPQG